MMMTDGGAQPRKTGFIGLSVMGSGIAKNIATKKGRSVIVWEEYAETLAKATNCDCTPASSLKNLLESVDIIGVCLRRARHQNALIRSIFKRF